MLAVGLVVWHLLISFWLERLMASLTISCRLIFWFLEMMTVGTCLSSPVGDNCRFLPLGCCFVKCDISGSCCERLLDSGGFLNFLFFFFLT